MLTDEIIERLYTMQDKKFGEFQSRLCPTLNADRFIGVRTPELRKYAKELLKRDDIGEFLSHVPHTYFDENQLHAFIISGIKDYERCMDEVCRFLPYVDNWATCDQMSPKVFKKHRPELLGQIKKWLSSDKVYTVRFAIGMLMEHFLDEDFDISYPQAVADIHSDEYYINMMIAWYFATALARQYDAILPFIEERRIDERAYNKTIQKAVESYRITDEQKDHLRTLRIKKDGKQP
ncbi:MAG: DNA alkylation repair protein [Oscillospiraceae bacterium]|nr:DNA alkylation repair protein [Oscillospiraceae bacterium]